MATEMKDLDQVLQNAAKELIRIGYTESFAVYIVQRMDEKNN